MTQEIKILIVESSSFFRSIERQFLSKTPAKILEAGSAEEALIIWQKETPELTYVAFDLPGLSAIDFCRQLKALAGTKQASVVLICDKNDAAQMTACQNAACDGILTKPIDRHKFLEIGRQFLPSIREPRRSCLFPITLRYDRVGADGAKIQGKCLDISSGGVFIETGELLDLNSFIMIEFVLPYKDHVKISCKGVVSWHNTRPNPTKPNYPIGIGVKFVDLDDEVQQSIKLFSTRFI
ncbi:MAG: response regulator [Desulfuromonadales bacterium]|nr:response regulator [Desulfuromonadales bacterium]